MAAGLFTERQWEKIEAELLRDPKGYGMPDGPREESMVLASFNIRKLGQTEKRVKGKIISRKRELEFMARFCARCDLIAIQEVQDNLKGLRYLKQKVDERVASEGEFGLLVSDITGEVPGEKGMAERLAFLYRKSRIKRMEMTSDLTVDRSGVLANLMKHSDEFPAAYEKFETELKAFEQKKRKKKQKLKLPAFLTFTRTPFVAAFEAPAAGGGDPLQFIAVNAHLIYGTMRDRKEEFKALISWMTHRLLRQKRMVAPNFILMGDLNSRWSRKDDAVAILAARLDLGAYHPEQADLDTFSTPNPRVRIDWILISKTLEFKAYGVVPDAVSDHLAVIAEVRRRR